LRATRAKLVLCECIGHPPFYEDAPRITSELAVFAHAANKSN
jgi:hypothetical protein